MRAAALVVFGLLGGALPPPQHGPDALRAELTVFAQGLRALRGGDESVRDSLAQSAERLAALGREDARDVLAFYAALPRAERERALAAEKRFEALWAEVRDAADASEAAWRARRQAILAELEEIAEEFREAADPTPAARALSLVARIREQRARGDVALDEQARVEMLDGAESRALEALVIFEHAGLVTPRLEPLWLLARLDDARGELSDANAGYRECLALAERVGNGDFQEHALAGMVALCERTGDVDRQRDLVRDAARRLGPTSPWWIARQWCELLLLDDEPAAVIALLTRSRPRAAAELADWHLLFGGALQRQGKNEEARAHFDEAFRLSKRQGAIAPDATLARARAVLAAGAPREALDLLAPLEPETLSLTTRARLSALRGAAHRALNELPAAEAALRSALAEAEGLESRLERSAGSWVFGEVAGLETVAQLADVLARGGSALEAARVAEEFQARALRQSRTAAVTAEDLVAWAASADGGLLTWIVGADTTVCVHVDARGEAVAATVPLAREALREAVRRLREAAIAGNETRARALAAQIEQRALPAEILERVRGAERVLCLAHGPLEELPFDLLPAFAAETRALVLPGLPCAAPGDAPNAEALASWSVLGDPEGAQGSALLPGARAETQEVATLRATNAVLGKAFDRAALRDALASGRALHVATHVALEPAGLLASDGTLGVDEIRALAPELPIAVLSACQTADGPFQDAQPLASLANAFLAGGTRGVCVTLWPVEDDAARAWSLTFHRALGAGARPCDAAAAARDDLRARGVSVSEWAAFRLAGRD